MTTTDPEPAAAGAATPLDAAAYTRILAVLNAHPEEDATLIHHPDGTWSLLCGCGSTGPAPTGTPWRHLYRQHLAAMLTETDTP